ncbi:MAG: 1-deoxy-D-xylulose-5-phosphate synthase [Verrucomicrobiales bacterium]
MSDSSNTLPPLLSQIQSPGDLKKLSDEELPALAQEIRDTLIMSLSETGGHLGPNLGVVELTIAMHRVFDSPEDKFLFDVSHQGYVHKLLTGRARQIGTIRQYEGLNGFLLRTESEHDCYGAGHAGTALSAALGMASARDLKGDDNHVVCVSGDAAFTCGPTLEALNNVAVTTDRLITVLNDNEWSIDKNVGALAKYFNALQTHPTYNGIREKAADFVGKVAGDSVRKFAHKIERNAKNLLIPNVLFEKFGIHYYGPIDGHDIPLLVKTFEHLKKQKEPVILHIITEKGRGYQPALEKPGKFHGLGPYKVEDGSTKAGAPTYSELFGRAVTDFAKKDPKITAITAAMPGGTKLETFKNELPERYFDVGIAEEHAALFACGHATQGLRPFLAIYSTFMQRAFDMIVHDIALQNLPVRLCMDRGGLSGDDGPTHHGLFDIGYLRHIPGIVHMQPKDEDEFIDMLWTMANYDEGPSAIRYPRGAGMGVQPKAEPQLLEIGKGEVLQDGGDVALIPLGATLDIAEEAKRLLEEKGHSVALINPRFIKPLDRDLLLEYGRKCRAVLTLEDHVLANGFGASVIELFHDEDLDTPVERIGWPDEFVEHGKPEILREKHGLTAGQAVAKVLPHLS